MATIGRRLEIAYPETDKGFLPVVARFHEFFIGSNATLIYQAMWGAVSFVLLIACANLANLLLARAIGRVRETSVRMALGAGRWRIVRQFVLESLMLSAAGGFVGWWIAKWGVRAYTVFASGSGLSPDIRGTWFDNVLDYSPDFRVFAYLAAISIGTGLLFGLAPARRLSKLDVNAALKDGGRGSRGHGGHLSGLLVVAEMALAIVLLAGAGVMIRSFWNVYTADVGFKAENVVVALLSLTGDRYRTGDAQTAFFDALAARVGTIPGVESVSVGALPGGGAQRIPYETEGTAPTDDQRRPRLWGSTIGPGYFATLGVSLLSGRDFNDTDRPSALPVLIVNERFANRHWPGQDPLGKRLRLFRGQTPGPWMTVVGIASNVAQNDPLQPDANALAYLPFRQAPRANSWIVARTRVPPGTISAAIRGEVRAMDSTLPIPLGPFALVDRMADRYRYRAITGVLFLACAAVALLLASVGLYAVVVALGEPADAGDRDPPGDRCDGAGHPRPGVQAGPVAGGRWPRDRSCRLVCRQPMPLKRNSSRCRRPIPVALVASSVVLALSAVLGCLDTGAPCDAGRPRCRPEARIAHNHRMRLATASLLACLFSAPVVAQSPVSAMAPTGTLRAVFLGSNPVHGRVDPKTGAVTGPVPDLVKEFARRLGVPFAIVPAPDAAGVIAALKNHTADVGFLAYDETRAREVDYSAAFIVMHNSYLVSAGSKIQNSADVDRAGITVAAVKGQTQELFVSSRLKNARVKVLPTMPAQAEVERLLTSGEVDAFAINRQRSLDAQTASGSKLRALADSFLEVDQCFVVAKGDGHKFAPIEGFMLDVRASGFVKESIERAGLTGGVDVSSGRK